MKKTLVIIAAILVMALTLGACGKFTCDVCGREKSGGKHTMKLLGAKVTICNDCYKEGKNAINNLW